MSHLGPWHLGKASSLQLSKTLICISVPRLLLEISSSGRWVGGRRIGGEGGRALTLHAPASRQQQGNCTRDSVPLGKNTVLRMLNLPRRGAGAAGGEQPAAQDCAEGSSTQEQELSPWLAFAVWDHQGNAGINENRVLGVCVSVSSLSPALQRWQRARSLDAVTGPHRMLDLEPWLRCVWAGAAAAGAGRVLTNLPILRDPDKSPWTASRSHHAGSSLLLADTVLHIH